MSRTEELRQQYSKDADMMASKSRFGYFTLLPSHTAARMQPNSSHRIIYYTQLLEERMEKS